MRAAGVALSLACAGVTAIRQEILDEQAEFLSDELTAEANLEDQEAWRKRKWRKRKGCAPGLTPAGTEYCKFDNPSLYAPSADEAFDIKWELPNPEPALIFRKKGGSFMLEHTFIEELVLATSDLGLSREIYTNFITAETAKDPNFQTSAKNFIKQVMELGLWGKKQYDDAQDDAEEKLELGTSMFERIKAAADLAGGIAMLDGTILLKGIQKVTGLADQVVTKYFPEVGQALNIAFTLKRMNKKLHERFLGKAMRSKDFQTHLAKGSACVSKATMLEKADVLETEEEFLNDEIVVTCGFDVAETLSKQMLRTNKAFKHLFSVISMTGQCMYPVSKAHVQCAGALQDKLREVRGESGILFEALSFAALYANAADELLFEPVYADLVEEKFGINIHDDFDEASVNHMNALWNTEDTDPRIRAEGCLSVIATQRAFERTLSKMASALGVWLRTYGRKQSSPSFRTAWQPCKKVFNKLEDSIGENFCVQSRAKPIVWDAALDACEGLNSSSLWPEF